MAQIDVSDLLLDADFAEDITLIRRASAVNAYGENVLAESSQTITAVVQSGDKEMLARLPDSARLSSYITVYYRGILTAETPGGYADIIVYSGKRYIVHTVDESYSNWGAGFTSALCVLEAANV